MSVTKQVSLHGTRAYLTKDDQLAGRNGFVAGGVGKAAIVYPSPDTSAVFDDFYINRGTPGTDTGVAGLYFERRAGTGDTGGSGAIIAGTNGIHRTIKGGGMNDTTHANASGISQAVLQWKANQGPGGSSGRLRMGARVKLDAYTVGSLFVGFTDTVASGEMPAYDTGGALFTPAADCVGFLYGERGDTGWMGVSAKSTPGDSGDQSVVLTTVAPTANTYVDLEVEVHRGISDTGGSATFYINGASVGRINSPIATSTALTPVALLMDVDTASSAVMDLDWMNVSGPRDTGI